MPIVRDAGFANRVTCMVGPRNLRRTSATAWEKVPLAVFVGEPRPDYTGYLSAGLHRESRAPAVSVEFKVLRVGVGRAVVQQGELVGSGALLLGR